MGWWHWGHLVDYTAIVGTFVAAQLLDNLPPFERPFNLNDPEIAYPHLPNIVSTAALILYCIPVPIAITFLIALLRAVYVLSQRGPSHIRGVERKRYVISMALREWHHFVVGLGLGLAVNNLFTDLTK
jgi:uncharacterized RDD family membrane protein YckC